MRAAAQKCVQLAGACTAKAETAANRTLTAVSVLEGSEMSVVADLFWQNGKWDAVWQKTT